MRKSFYKRIEDRELLIEVDLRVSGEEDDLCFELSSIDRVYDEDELEDISPEELDTEDVNNIYDIIDEWIEKNYRKLVREYKNIDY